MDVYYKIVGHLEDDQQEVGTYIFNDEQPTSYIEKKFKRQLLEESGYDFDSFNKNEELREDIDSIFEVLETVIDKYYAKIERAKSKQPEPDW